MTPADSLQAASHLASRAVRAFGDVPPGAMTHAQAAQFFEGWHEFYLLAGTAAVTLVGLLFVALSMHLDVLIHESKVHVLAHARSTLLTFSYVLVVSLFVLVPHQNAVQMGVMLTVVSLIMGGTNLIALLRQHGTIPADFERSMRRRGRVQLVGYIIALLTGIAMLVTGVPQLLFNLIAVICMMLGNAMGVSWDLLVEVGKLQAELAHPKAATRK